MALKRPWVASAQIAASAVLLILAVLIVRPARLWEELRTANAMWLGVSLVFVPVIMLLRSVRWHIIARTRNPMLSYSESLNSYMAGLALAVVTPWAAGELARGAVAAPDDKAGFVGLTFVDKLLDFTVVYLFACAGLFVVLPWGYKALAAIAAAIPAAGWAVAGRMAGAFERYLPAWKFAEALRRAIGAYGQVGARVLGAAFVLAAVNAAVYYGQLYAALYAFAPSVKPGAVAFFPLITMSRIIPSVGGLGSREFVAAQIFGRADYSVPAAAAVNAAFIQYVSANVLPAAVWLALTGKIAGLLARRREKASDGSH